MIIYIMVCVGIFTLGAVGQVMKAIKKNDSSEGIAAIFGTLMAAAGIALLIKNWN